MTQSSIVDPYGDPVDTGTLTGGTLLVSDLPKYDGTGSEWLYYISETDIKDDGGTDLSGNYTAVYRDKNNYSVQAGHTYSGGSITNTRSTRELTLTKQVGGNMGDRMKSYSFTLTLQNPDDSAYTGSVPYTLTLYVRTHGRSSS